MQSWASAEGLLASLLWSLDMQRIFLHCLFVLFLSLSTVGCLFQLRTPLSLKNAESSSSSLIASQTAPGLFQDDWAEIAVSGDTQQIELHIKNLSDKESLKIVWDDCSFIDTQGNVDRIIHGGIKLKQAGESMPPTNIPKGAKINDVAFPSSRVTWTDNGWNQSPIAYMSEQTQEVGLLLVLQKGDARREYTFTFIVPSSSQGNNAQPQSSGILNQNP